MARAGGFNGAGGFIWFFFFLFLGVSKRRRSFGEWRREGDEKGKWMSGGNVVCWCCCCCWFLLSHFFFLVLFPPSPVRFGALFKFFPVAGRVCLKVSLSISQSLRVGWSGLIRSSFPFFSLLVGISLLSPLSLSLPFPSLPLGNQISRAEYAVVSVHGVHSISFPLRMESFTSHEAPPTMPFPPLPASLSLTSRNGDVVILRGGEREGGRKITMFSLLLLPPLPGLLW
jgi:hypothetical protein